MCSREVFPTQVGEPIRNRGLGAEMPNLMIAHFWWYELLGTTQNTSQSQGSYSQYRIEIC